MLIPKLTLYLNVISYEPKNTTIMKPTIDFVNLDDDTLSSVLNELNQLFPQFDVKSVQQQINI